MTEKKLPEFKISKEVGEASLKNNIPSLSKEHYDVKLTKKRFTAKLLNYITIKCFKKKKK